MRGADRILWRSRGGMTLPELMIVIAIIALLVYGFWIWLRDHIREAKEVEAKGMVQKICDDLRYGNDPTRFFTTPWVPNDTPGKVKQSAGDGMEQIAQAGGSNLLQGRALQCSYKAGVKEVIVGNLSCEDVLVVAVCDADADGKSTVYAAGYQGSCVSSASASSRIRSEVCASLDVGLIPNAIALANAAFLEDDDRFSALEQSLGR